MKNCIICNKPLDRDNSSGYCQQHLIEKRQQEKIRKWLEDGDIGMTVNTTIRGVIRQYILNEQKHKCAICGIQDIWNDKTLNFVMDHIDGNALNSVRENLRLVCPNCDSQLDTFKSKNKNSPRCKRKDYIYQ